MPRSRRPYGKAVQKRLSSTTNTDAYYYEDDKSINHDEEENMTTRNGSSSKKLLPDDSPAGVSSSLLESNSSNAVHKGVETTRRRQDRRRKKVPLRETTNLHPEVSSNSRDNLFSSSNVSKKKKKSPGDEITPRVSNCNKIKQQKRSSDDTKYFFPSPSKVISPKRKQMDDIATETVKESQTEDKGQESSEGSGMDCSSDSLGLESPKNFENQDKKINVTASKVIVYASKPTSSCDERILHENHHSEKKISQTDNVEKLYPDSNLVDSNGYPRVSKGLMKRALTSEADNESVLQVLMSSCGGRNRKRPKSIIPSSASSAHSDLTLGSSTLLGATIPLKRCDSFDSTLTYDSYGKFEERHTGFTEVDESNGQNVTLRHVQKGIKTTHISSRAILEHASDFPRPGLPPANRNRPYNSYQANANAGHIRNTAHIAKSCEEFHHKRNDAENDDGTVQTIDSENRSVVIHPKLPPGWRVKVSRSKKQVYYVHPDFGSTWHCPVVTQKPVLIKKLQKPNEETCDNEFDKHSMVCNDETKRVSKVGKIGQPDEIHEVQVVDTENLNAGAIDTWSHGPSFENEDECPDQDPVMKEIVLSMKQKRKFSIYEDPVSENELIANAIEEHGTDVNHSQQDTLQMQLLHQERQTDKVNNSNSGEQNPPFQQSGTRATAGSTKKNSHNSVNVEISMAQKTAQNSSMYNGSKSEESSISNVDNSPRYLDFSNEAEVDSFDEVDSDKSHDHHMSEKSSDESMPLDSTSSRSSNNLLASSSPNISDSAGNTRQELGHENIQSIRETLAERLARLHHPLCSLQRLDDIIRDKKLRKSPTLYHSRSNTHRVRRMDKIRVSYGKG
jgi:hypothetical protein